MTTKKKPQLQTCPPRLLLYTSDAELPDEVIERLADRGVVALKVANLNAVRVIDPMPSMVTSDQLMVAAAGAILAHSCDAVRAGFGKRVAQAIEKAAAEAKP